MKKAALFLLVGIMILLCSCNSETPVAESTTSKNEESNTTSGSQATTIPPQRIEHIAEKIEQGMIENLDEYSDEEKEQIKEAIEKDGYTIEFKDDGSGVLSNEEGEWTVAAGWVNNDYTEGIPEIDYGEVTMSMEDEDQKGAYYMFLIRKADFLEVENYVETLEQVGFTKIESKVVEQSSNTIVFVASNSAGKLIELGYSQNGFTLKLYK